MSRKEVYATTGTRLMVRIFAGFDFTPEDVQRHDFAKYGYQKGVPMGGDLKAAPQGKAPTFLIRALRDADGANLDRVQVVKGWLDAKGETHEQIWDVAVSGDRKIEADGRCKTPVGNTVNVADASYKNTIGAPMLLGYWKDPNFNSEGARLLLRPRDRDPHAALDDLRRKDFPHEASGKLPNVDPGPRLHVADLVHTR